MSTRNATLRTLLAGCVVLQSMAPSVAPGDPGFGRLGRLVHEATYHGHEPATCEVGAIEELAENIDWLEHHIDRYGSIVAKQPDIWGEARLTKHRDEYERMMFTRLGEFGETINAAISSSDGAFMTQALALSAAAGGATITPADPKAPPAIPAVNAQLVNVQAPLADINNDTPSYARFGIAEKVGEPGITLEPTIYLDQMSRYLQHLHELRRLGEGDDTSDSPGYALNLVRIPVSILPGKLTREGFGAEVTVTCTPVLSDDLLPTTFQNLVVNDVVDHLRLPVTRIGESAENILIEAKKNPAYIQWLRTLQSDYAVLMHRIDATETDWTSTKIFAAIAAIDLMDYDARARLLNCCESSAKAHEAVCDIKNTLERLRKDEQRILNSAIKVEVLVQSASPTTRSRETRHPVAPSTLVEVYGKAELFKISNVFRKAYFGHDNRWNGCDDCVNKCGKPIECRIHLLDVQQWLDSQAAAAYELLAEPEHVRLYASLVRPESGLASQLRNGHIETEHGHQCAPSVAHYRHYFFKQLHNHDAECTQAADIASEVLSNDTASFLQHEVWDDNPEATAESSVEAIAWAIVVEAALLNDRLNTDVRKLAEAKEVYELQTNRDLWFFLPDTVMEPDAGLEDLQGEYQTAADIFQHYVKARWPIHVFAVDPREQDQNVADVSARKREMQFALALGFVTGKIGVNSLTQFSRELETQVETITLNRTIIGFGHGNDTFGWRFQPRVQALEVPGTLGVIRETLCGASRDYELKHRQLEPGQRECTAVVLMPSFIPYADFHVRTNWYKLTNPKNSALTMKDTVRLSRAVTTMRNSRAQCSQCAHLYRDGEVARMMKRVEQLDREMPLQSMRSMVPYENTLGGFEMFNVGVTDLAPELIGWHGAPGINLELNECGCYQGCQAINAECTDADSCTKLNAQLKELGTTVKALNADVGIADDPLPPCNGPGTTLFLVGKNFSVHDTKVIAGGVCIPHARLVSREIMQVTIPHCVNKVEICENGNSCVKNRYVSVYVATPYGVTNHLHVPVINGQACECGNATPPCPQAPAPVAAPASILTAPSVISQEVPDTLPPPQPEDAVAEPLSSGSFPGGECDSRTTDWSPWPESEVTGSPFRLVSSTDATPPDPMATAIDANGKAIGALSKSVDGLAASPVATTGAKTLADALTANGVAITALSTSVGALAASPSATDGAKTMAESITANGKAITALSESIQALSDSTAALKPQPTIINVEVSPVMPAPECDHDCDHDHPLLGQLKTQTMECWRNVRDQLPCY